MSASMKLSDYVMQFLVDHGVRHVFMLPGGGAMHLDDSLGRSQGLEYVVLLHEQALSIAAEAYGQHTDTPGVGLVTSGPGGTNAVTGVAAAFFDSTPCLFISGQAKRADLKRDSGVRQMGSQEVDIVSIVAPITKYAAMVTDPMDVRLHLERAWHEATSGRRGPVWLDIPLDVQAAEVEPGALRGFEAAPPAATDREGSVRVVARLLASAERPLVLAGNGVKLAGSQTDLMRVLEDAQVPFVLTWKTIDMVGHDHPLFFGCPGIMGCRTANFLVQNCDLLLVVGSRLDPSLTAFDTDAFGKHARRVVVDIDEAEVRKLGDIDMPIVMDAGEFLRALAGQTASHGAQSAWLDYARSLRDRYPVVLDEHRERDDIDLYAFTEMLFDHLAEDDVIVPESSGAAGEVTYQAMRVKQGQKVRNAAGLGAMGFGLPYAIGACVANDRRRTILINGDGAFQLNLQELETVVRLRLPVKMFVLDNDGYASIRAMQRNQFDGLYVGSSPDSGLTLPGLDGLASAYGLRFEEARDARGLETAVLSTLDGDDPVLCRVVVSEEQVTAPRVQAMRTPEGSMVSKPLEDMWPYLPREELAELMIAERLPAHDVTGETT